MRVLGISAFYHDSAAALVEDGRVVAAAQEERFTRVKHDETFPDRAIEATLEHAGVRLADVDHVVFYEKPFTKFERLLETYLAFAPRGFSSFRAAMPLWLRDKLFQKLELGRALKDLDPGFQKSRLLFSEHHLSHAASAFYPSPFREAAILTLDGVGEWATTTVGMGHDNRLELSHEITFPHSLGMLYSAFTYYTGFKVNSGEYKLMGLAPYGQPRYEKLIRDHLVELKPDGSFRLNLDYFDYCTGLRMTNERFARLFGGPPRQPDEPIEQRHMDLASSIQSVTNDMVLAMTRHAAELTGAKYLCMAGGVALNCVANGHILRDGRFERIWIQPAAGDAGGALGAALVGYYMETAAERACDGVSDGMCGALLGPSFTQGEVERRLSALDARFAVLDEDELLDACVDRLERGEALGWFQGRMEFGPRALGARSILCDPRNPDAQRVLNQKIKKRESFRPFAPAVLAEEASQWFELDSESPYMLLVAPVATSQRSASVGSARGFDQLHVRRSSIPAVTHVDYSARVQTVNDQHNPRFHGLLTRFFERTGCPVLVNTSFNVRGEPIVCTPEDAFRCYMGTELDTLVVGRCLLDKPAQVVTVFPAAAFPPD